VKLTLTPVAADPVAVQTDDGSTAWSARTDDPMFIARPANGGKLRAGWHSATVELKRREGEILEPQLYLPDTAGRFAEARSVRLVGEGSTYSAEFFLAHAVDHLRFDPSRAPCVFACEALNVERTRHVRSLVDGLRSVTRRAAAPVLYRARRMAGGHRQAETGPRGAATPEMLSFWEERGYLVLPGFYSGKELDAAQEALERAWATNAPRIVVDDLMTGERLRLMDVSEEARREHRFKVNDLFLERDEVRDLALNPRLTPIIRDLLGHVPVICNSLSFHQGSGQPDHVDALYMTPPTPGHLVAIWVALEDCDMNAGPLRYFPGSHKIPPYVFSSGKNTAIAEEMDQWRAYMREHVEAMGLTPEVFPARRGDVFVWSAYLLHGGSPIVDPTLTRKSIVFHYLSEEDCRALNFRLVPSHGGYWMHRRHPAVPGLGESDFPPLPDA
jgi:ectoine hydroxylase-related dioxygenase (phytanoyl-CoA dioxygenase family)